MTFSALTRTVTVRELEVRFDCLEDHSVNVAIVHWSLTTQHNPHGKNRRTRPYTYIVEELTEHPEELECGVGDVADRELQRETEGALFKPSPHLQGHLVSRTQRMGQATCLVCIDLRESFEGHFEIREGPGRLVPDKENWSFVNVTQAWTSLRRGRTVRGPSAQTQCPHCTED